MWGWAWAPLIPLSGAADPPGADPCRADGHCQQQQLVFNKNPQIPPILAAACCSVAGGIGFSMGTRRWWDVKSGMLKNMEASCPFCSIFVVVPRIPALHPAPFFFGGRKVALRTQGDGWREPQPQGFTDHSLVYLGQGDGEELGSPALGVVAQSWHHPNVPEPPRLDSAMPCAGFTLPGILRVLALLCGWGEGDPKGPRAGVCQLGQDWCYRSCFHPSFWSHGVCKDGGNTQAAFVAQRS